MKDVVIIDSRTLTVHDIPAWDIPNDREDLISLVVEDTRDRIDAHCFVRVVDAGSYSVGDPYVGK